jgi:hypothetical protein
MPAPFYCIVAGRRCKKPHAEIGQAVQEATRLHGLYEGRKAVSVLMTVSTFEQTNFTPEPEGFDPENKQAAKPEKKGPVVKIKKRRVVPEGV